MKQGQTTLYVFAAHAKTLDTVLEINQRESDKDIGYQRTLSESRVRSISDFVHKKNEIPTAIVVSLRDATFDRASSELLIPNRPDSGWVIDGQHRMAGATKRLSHGLTAARIDALLRKWLGRLPHPFSSADRVAGLLYQVSILQAEFSLTQVLDRPLPGVRSSNR